MPKRSRKPRRTDDENEIALKLVARSTEEAGSPLESNIGLEAISRFMKEMGRKGGKKGGKGACGQNDGRTAKQVCIRMQPEQDGVNRMEMAEGHFLRPLGYAITL